MKKTIIIAEAGVNHNGSLKLAKKLGLEIILNNNNPTSIQNLASIIKTQSL